MASITIHGQISENSSGGTYTQFEILSLHGKSACQEKSGQSTKSQGMSLRGNILVAI